MKYYGFINQNIQREIENNTQGNIIFESQRESDGSRLEELLKDKDEILVDFSNDWHEAQTLLYRIDKESRLKATRQYVSIKILEALEERYPKIKEYEGSKNLDIFKKYDIESYKSKEKTLYNIQDVLDLLSIEDINIDRIYFMIHGESLLCDALTILLSDDNPFNITIYSSESSFSTFYDPDSIEKKRISEIYSYTTFNKGEEGKSSYKLSSKQKRKKK